MYLVAGLDETLRYSRTGADGARIHPTGVEVSLRFDGAPLTVSSDPEWDDSEQIEGEDGTVTGQEWRLPVLGSEKPSAGKLEITWSGVDPDGRAFSDTETAWVLTNDAPDAGLVLRTRHFLRLDADDPVIPALVGAAQAYIANAGVRTPPAYDEQATALYELAVSIFVSTIYSGGDDKLGDSLTSILLQIRA